jgi:filamentous hemagglutinin family protein
LTGGVLALSGSTDAFADSGLPIAVNAAGAVQSTITELGNATMHPGVDVGHASASYSADGHKLTIHQTSDKAILDWDSFDIAEGNSVQFQQPASTSVALNNIHQVDASQILGDLKANGQVYLVNSNGFVFGKHATVNTNSLLATNLKISDTVFEQGLTNVVDSGAGNGNLTPVAALAGDGSIYRDTGNGHREKISILVEKGATIAAEPGGRVILAAPEVENDGSISAPDGQVILAAATDKVYLQQSNSDDLRGLLVEVQTGGDVKNVGKILTERGNTTLMGFAVSQQGIVSASTSVALNGSIKLLAHEGAKLEKNDNNTFNLKPISTHRSTAADDGLGNQAAVTLAADSLTTVTLDDSAGSAVNGQVQPHSTIDIEAGNIRLQSGSQIVAHGGKVDLIASESPGDALASTSAANASRIVLENGSKIDVSGVKNVELAMSSNVVDVELRNNELRDAPIQKTGILHGKTVQVDVRSGTPLADISGAVDKVKHSIAERSIAAGSVNLHSEGEVIVSQGADVDISGGSLHYLGGNIQTTQLISNGVAYDIAKADPNRTYQQILSVSHYQPGYFQGGDAGVVDIKSRSLALDGNIFANTIEGLYQRDSSAWPEAGQLNVDSTWSNQAQQDVLFQTAPLFAVNEQTASTLYLSSALFANGLNRLNIATGGKLTIAANTSVNLSPGGQLVLQAGEIDLQGNIGSAGGSVQLKTQRGLDPTRNLSGQLHLEAGSSIDSSGSWINDNSDHSPSALVKPISISGGSISLQAQGDLLLDSGSMLSANGGAWLHNDFKLTAGKGGNISLISAGLQPSQLLLGSELSAYGLENGGGLSIAANDITIGDSQIANPASTLNLARKLLQSGGFSHYNLTANAGNLTINDNTAIQLRQQNWQLNAAALFAASGADLSQLVHLAVLPDDVRQAVNLNLDLAHNATIAGGYHADRAITIGNNAVISADPGASLTLNSDANIRIAGTLSAAAGDINLTLTTPPSSIDSGYNPNQAIRLTQTAQLNASGTTVRQQNPAGLALGEVKAGGTVSLTANRGYILMDDASSIDVSGSAAKLDIINSQGWSRQTIASSAGSIHLTAAEGMVLQGQLLAHAGAGHSAAGDGWSVAGGSLNIELNAQHRGEPEGVVFNSNDRVINVGDQPATLLNSEQIAGGEIPVALNGQAYIATQQIKDGGFDNLKLASSVIEPDQYSPAPSVPERGEIRFDGDVALTLKQNLTLDAPLISHSGNGGKVALTGNTVNLGSSWNRAAHGNLAAVGGPDDAVLEINANNIDLLGSSEISGFTQTRLNSQGDIRLIGVNPESERDLVGSLSLSGNLAMTAREIYPTTLSKFSLTVDSTLNPDGNISILPATETSATPLSAAGQLNISAANISSQGNLLVPFGTINLNAGKSLNLAAGSFTSVSDDDGVMIPFGRTQGGLDWIYTLGLYNNIQSGTPQKAITLSSPDINLADGAHINLNGGGDLSAFEFIAGPGGSVDYLDSSSAGYSQNYAIVPNFKSAYAPYDALEFAKSGLSLGDSIYLSADSGLAAGNYVLLPAHYALLPGAFLVTPLSANTDMASGTTATRTDGATIVSGYRYVAGSQVADSRWSGFAIESGSVARSRSEYQETTASRFFPANTATGSVASLPQDAGNLSLLAQQNLNLSAQISATAATGGLGGMLDISANQLTVVGQRGDTVADGTIMLLAEDLNKLGVDSILLGGRRTRGAGTTQLNVSAQTVTIAGDSHLSAPEILLTASDSISMESGASISAVGNLRRSDSKLSISNTDGALLRVSSAGQASVSRDSSGLNRQSGTLDIAEGAQLASSGSILLEASKDNRFHGDIVMDKGELTLSSSLITLGGESAASGLQLSDAALNQLHVDKLTLNSYSTVAIADSVNLNLKQLLIDAAAIDGFVDSGQAASITADSIRIQNSASSLGSPSPIGSGSLNLSAKTITLAGGDYAVRGFKQVNLDASGSLLGSGHGTLTADADVEIKTPVWTATSGADTALNLGNHDLTIAANGSAISGNELGAKLAVSAENIWHQGRIELASGVVKLDAAQNLTIAGSIDTSGRDIDLAGNHRYSGGGSIILNAEQGDLTLQTDGSLNVSSSQLGGDAGNLAVSAANGKVSLDGSMVGKAYQGAKGGGFNLDARNTAFTDFSALNGLLQSGSFNADLSIRQRQGDLLIAGSDVVKADNISLSADTGRLTVAGVLDVGGAQAGTLRLSAGDQIDIVGGSKLNAVSSASGNAGGKVILTSIDADADGLQGVSIASGAQLNVDGGANGKGGNVEIIVNRLATDDAAVAIANGTVHGASSMKVAAMAHYLDVALTNNQIQQWHHATQAYLDAAAQNSQLQQRLAGFEFQPGLDIASSGNLNFDLTESLKGFSWQKAGSQTWSTRLADVAGGIDLLQQIASNGSVKTFSNANTIAEVDGTFNLSTNLSYYFDQNPDSATFRTLFVRIDNAGSNPRNLAGSLISHNGWDLTFKNLAGENWHFGSEQSPGLLSLRSAGDLDIKQTISDGFAVYDKNQLAAQLGTSANWLSTLVLQTGSSWSYHLIGGADLASANALDVSGSGAVNIGSASSVRTGTGDITVAAAGDIKLSDWTSTIYSAGHASPSNRYGSFSNALVAGFFVDYPVDGGDVSLTAGGNIVGAATPQLMSDWLERTGNWDPSNGIDSKDRATAWGIAFDGLVIANSTNAKIQNLKFGFRENIGALGGGDVKIRAGNDIQDLSVMLPSSAKPVGAVNANGVIVENVWQHQGGGNLDIAAGGDIAGGVFYVDKGHADIRAGSAITGGTQFSSGPVFALGDAQFNVQAGSGIAVGAVLNPFVLTEPKFLDKTSYFTSYSANSGISLQSLAGDISFNNDTALIQRQYKIFDQSSPQGRPILNSSIEPLLTLYPGNLQAYALTGGMEIANSLSLYPAAASSLDLMAAGDIRLGNNNGGVTVNQLDVDPRQLLSPERPTTTITGATQYLYTTAFGNDPTTLHAKQPIHLNDNSRNQIVSAHGSIVGNNATLAAAKATDIWAGLDLINLDLKIQNLHGDDTTSIIAGRDIIYPILRDATTDAVKGSSAGIELAGPGLLNVWAGRNIDLGSSEGITTVGPIWNAALPAQGADILVLAGNKLSQDSQPLDDFLQHYVGEGDYQDQAARLNQAVTSSDKLQLAVRILFAEIRASAKLAAASQGLAQQTAYQRGYDAISRLFPNSPSGDIILFFSRIQSLEGGDINLLAPGGMINAGLASAFTGQKTQDQLGIVAQRQGDINILLKNDLLVNQSRIFTLDSGDITAWSSEGNIDAGRGAKSALATPQPKISVDANGNLTVEFPATVSGSGIRAQSGYNSPQVGNVILAAPRGVVDAGEAGIGGGDITIAATAVIGASNIQSLGNMLGVPQAPSTIVMPESASNAATAASKASGTSVDENAGSGREDPSKQSTKVAIINAQLVGFGSCSVADVREKKEGCDD